VRAAFCQPAGAGNRGSQRCTVPESKKQEVSEECRSSQVPENRQAGSAKDCLGWQYSEIHLSHFTPVALKRLVEKFGFSVAWNTLDPYYVASGRGKWKEVDTTNAAVP